MHRWSVCIFLPRTMYSSTLVFLVCVVAAFAQTAERDFSSLKVISRAVERCSSDPDMFSCLKVKAVTLLDRALTTDSLPLSEFVTITKNPNIQDTPTPIFQDLESSLPRDLGEKNSALDKMIQDKLSKYLETRTIQVNMPKDVFEGRRKYKKGGGLFIVFGAFAAMLLQLALGKIAVIAGKALLVGKVALLLAGIIGLKSLLSHHGESHSSQVIYAEPEHHGGWGRSMGSAQDVVYRGQRPSHKH